MMINVCFTKRGDFFEFSGKYAAGIAKILGIVVHKNHYGDDCIGIPIHRFDEWNKELIAAGYKVHIRLSYREEKKTVDKSEK